MGQKQKKLTLTVTVAQPEWRAATEEDEVADDPEAKEQAVAGTGDCGVLWGRYLIGPNHSEGQPEGWWLSLLEDENGRRPDLTGEWGDAGPYATKEELMVGLVQHALWTALGETVVRLG